jgi:hypothetical protein
MKLVHNISIGVIILFLSLFVLISFSLTNGFKPQLKKKTITRANIFTIKGKVLATIYYSKDKQIQTKGKFESHFASLANRAIPNYSDSKNLNIEYLVDYCYKKNLQSSNDEILSAKQNLGNYRESVIIFLAVPNNIYCYKILDYTNYNLNGYEDEKIFINQNVESLDKIFANIIIGSSIKIPSTKPTTLGGIIPSNLLYMDYEKIPHIDN